MKEAFKSLGLSTLKFLGALAISSVIFYMKVEGWVDGKIEDAKTEIKTMRQGDMLLIDSRLKNIETDTKLIKEHLLK